jgi:hypothetical protein
VFPIVVGKRYVPSEEEASNISLLTRAKAQLAVLNELRNRGAVPNPSFPEAILEHIVGRNVLVLPGDNTNELVEKIEDYGYDVTVLDGDAPQWPIESFDTVIILRAVDEDTLEEAETHAHFAVILKGGTPPESSDYRSYKDGLIVYERYAEENVLTFSATVVERLKIDELWDYRLELGDHRVVRATAEAVYRNGDRVLLTADGVVTNGNVLGILNGIILTSLPIEGKTDTTASLLVRAIKNHRVYEGESTTTEIVLEGLDLTPDQLIEARRLLSGFVGTEFEARVFLQDRLHLPSEDDLALTIDKFAPEAPNAEGPHKVVGVLLEPETPYGEEQIWFSAETIKRIYGELTQGALDHIDASPEEVRILRSMLDEQGDYAKPGSWLIECEVSNEVYDAIIAGKYTGFSIRGSGLMAGGQ